MSVNRAVWRPLETQPDELWEAIEEVFRSGAPLASPVTQHRFWLLQDVMYLNSAFGDYPAGGSPFSDFRGRIGEAVEDTAVVTMVRNESATIAEWLRYHHALGFRRFVVIDHNSTDGTAEVASAESAKLLDCEVVVVRESGMAYIQKELTTGAARLALCRWPDVRRVIPLDNDEYLCTQSTVREALSIAPPLSGIRFPLLDQVSRNAIEDTERRLTGDVGQLVQDLRSGAESGWLDAFESTCPTLVYKVALGRDSLARHGFVQGNHGSDALLPGCLSGVAVGLVIRHVQDRTATAYLAKARKAAEAGYGEAERSRDGGQHWESAASQSKQRDFEGLIREWAQHRRARLDSALVEDPVVRESMTALMSHSA